MFNDGTLPWPVEPTEADPQLDLGDRKSTDEADKAARQTALRHREVLKALLQHEGGRDWLYHLFTMTAPFVSPFSADPVVMAHAVGQQNLGRYLFNEIMLADPAGYLKMMEEHSEPR